MIVQQSDATLQRNIDQYKILFKNLNVFDTHSLNLWRNIVILCICSEPKIYENLESLKLPIQQCVFII
jgi:hypothetical protein